MSARLRISILVLMGLGLGLLGWRFRRLGKFPEVSPTEVPSQPQPLSSPSPSPEQGTVAPSGKFEPMHGGQTRPGIPSSEAMQAAVQNYIKEINPNELRVGEVRLLKKERTLIFPATVAVRTQPLEYALVHESGKAHEALLVTKVPVQDVHVAALLIEASGQVPTLEVSWKKHGGEARMPLSDLIRIEKLAADTISANPWSYNGSKFQHGSFAAMSEGSMVALVNDPAALVNHAAAGALLRDDVFFARTENLPPAGVTVSVAFIFPAQK